MPAVKTYTQDAPESDSDYDFSEYNDSGRLHYYDRVFEGTLTAVGGNMTQLHMTMTKLAQWLFGGWKTLEFDDMPGTLWTAKVENPDQVSFDLGRIGTASIYFRVKPFSKWFLNSMSGGIPLDSKILLQTGIPLDLNLSNVFNFVAGNQTFTLSNLGDYYTQPKITVTGSFSQFTIGIGAKTYTYSASATTGDVLVIDCQTQIITKNGVNAMKNVTGNPFELAPGENVITINSNGTGQASVLFDYNFINMAVI
jgi:phage-related protein